MDSALEMYNFSQAKMQKEQLMKKKPSRYFSNIYKVIY